MISTVEIHKQYGEFLKRKDKVEGSLNSIATARLGTAFSFNTGLEQAACELKFTSPNSNATTVICISMTAALNLRDQLNAALRKNGVIVS